MDRVHRALSWPSMVQHQSESPERYRAYAQLNWILSTSLSQHDKLTYKILYHTVEEYISLSDMRHL